MQQPRKSTTQIDHRDRVLAALDFIHANLEDDLSTEALAHRFCASPFHFHRIFQAVAGETPKQHVRRLRLERAAMRLWISQEPVIDIALDAGYSAHEAFSKAFRQRFGRSPSDARRAGRQWISPYNGKDLEVQVVTLPERRLAGIPAIGAYQSAQKTFDRVKDWSATPLPTTPTVLGLYWNNQDLSPARLCRYEACVEIDAEATALGRLSEEPFIRSLKATTYARLAHHGPLSTLRQTVQHLIWGFMPRNRIRFESGPTVIEYSGSQGEASTMIYVPVS